MPRTRLRARDVLQRLLPGVWITTSAEVVPEFREYERFSTTVINAYLLRDRVHVVVEREASEAGYRGKVFTMSSGGGSCDLDAARGMPVRTACRARAGGVPARCGSPRPPTCAMSSLRHGRHQHRCLADRVLQAASVSEPAFAGCPIKGGEVTSTPSGRRWQHCVHGSRSHIASRPAQRGRGARAGVRRRGGVEPTVTDADVVLGRLGPRLLGGVIWPELERATAAVAALADRLDVTSVEEMAEGIVRHRRCADGQRGSRDLDRGAATIRPNYSRRPR